jgi:predicted RNase H-like HicB family nuclease
MKQHFHTIIKSEANGTFVGWVEEIPGALTHGRSLDECRHKLRDSLQLMIDTHRDQARLGLDASCIQESIELDVLEPDAQSDAPAQPADYAEYGVIQGHA